MGILSGPYGAFGVFMTGLVMYAALTDARTTSADFWGCVLIVCVLNVAGTVLDHYREERLGGKP